MGNKNIRQTIIFLLTRLPVDAMLPDNDSFGSALRQNLSVVNLLSFVSTFEETMFWIVEDLVQFLLSFFVGKDILGNFLQ